MKSKVVSLFLLIFAFCSFFSLAAYAEGEDATEETTETPAESTTIAVSDATLAAKLDILQEALDKIAAAVAPAEGETSEESPAPDYSEQLASLAADVAEIKETVQATPEQAEPDNIWSKSFEDYTPLEGYALLVFVIVLVAAFVVFVRRF